MHRLRGGGAGRTDVHGRAFRAYPLRELAVAYRDDLHQEVLAEREGVLLGPGVVAGEVLLYPEAQRLLVLRGFDLAYQRVVNLPHLGGGAALVLPVEVAGGFAQDGVHDREGRGEDHAGLGAYVGREHPFFRQPAAGGGPLVVMDERYARVLQRQHAGRYGHFESGVQGLYDIVRQAEFLLYVELAFPGGELYGLVYRIYLLYPVVAVRRFDHADDVLLYLLFAPVPGQRLYHVAPGQDLVDVVLAEHLAPGPGGADGNAGDGDGVEVEAVPLGQLRLLGRQAGRRGLGTVPFTGERKLAVEGDCPRILQRPVAVIRVEELAGVFGVLAVPLQLEAQRHHIGQQVVQLGDAAALGVVGRQDGHVGPVLEGGRGEGAQHALGAALYEGAHAVGVHPLQLLYEFHRAGHLLYQQVVDGLLVGREIIRGHVGEQRHVPGIYRDAFQELAVGSHRGFYDLGMEGVRDRYLSRLYAEAFEQLYRLFHGYFFSGYDGLQRAVLVGADHVALYFLEFFLHLVGAQRHGGHLARVLHLYVGHLLGAVRYGPEAVLQREHAGGGGGRVFAQAVAYHHIRLYAERGQQAVHGHVGGHHGRLRHLRLLDGGLALFELGLGFAGLGPERAGQRGADHLFKDAVGFVEGFLHHVVLGGQVAHHVHVLRALPGEQQADLRGMPGALESVEPLQLELQGRFVPGLGLRVLVQEGYLFLQVGRGFGDYGNAPFVLLFGVERLGEKGQRVGLGPAADGRFGN